MAFFNFEDLKFRNNFKNLNKLCSRSLLVTKKAEKPEENTYAKLKNFYSPWQLLNKSSYININAFHGFVHNLCSNSFKLNIYEQKKISEKLKCLCRTNGIRIKAFVCFFRRAHLR